MDAWLFEGRRTEIKRVDSSRAQIVDQSRYPFRLLLYNHSDYMKHSLGTALSI